MNPIVEAVMAGHVNHGNKCVECKKPYPCEPILQARKDNVHYVPVPDSPAGLVERK